MRKFAVALFGTLALVAIPVASAPAAGNETTKFTATYADPIYGAVSCTGNHLVRPNKFAGSRDVEHCKSTEASTKLTNLVAGETGSGLAFPGASNWQSDFNAAAAMGIEWTVSSNDRVVKIVSNYAS